MICHQSTAFRLKEAASESLYWFNCHWRTNHGGGEKQIPDNDFLYATLTFHLNSNYLRYCHLRDDHKMLSCVCHQGVGYMSYLKLTFHFIIRIKGPEERMETSQTERKHW